jgi:ankyrin repeat protein
VVQAAVRLLLRRKANPNARDKNGETPLHYATSQDRTAVARQLIRAHAKVDIRDKKGRTPLQAAVERENKKLIKTIRRHGGRK